MKSLLKRLMNKKINKELNFLQVNIGDENQKSGINKNDLSSSFYCKEIKIDLVGLMCIPPTNVDRLL